MVKVDLLDHLAGSARIEEETSIAGRDTEDSRVGVVDSGGGELARGDVAFGFEAGDCALGAQVPPADGLVVACRGQDVVVDVPHDRFDAAVVLAHADLVALGGRAGRHS